MVRMRQIPADVSPKDQVGQNAFNFIQIHGHLKPFESAGDKPQRYLMLFENFVHAFEEISIANCLALFQQQVRPLSNETILILYQAVLKRSQVALLDSLDQWLEFV